MAEYKGIFGTKIQNYTSDPDNPITGQVWYNETDQVMKFQYPTTIDAWSTGGSLNTARSQTGSSGTQSSTLSSGGYNGTATTNITESYNGSAWTEVADLNTARRVHNQAGVDNTSALAFGGGFPNFANTESWNGTSWTEVNDLNTARAFVARAGTQTAALAAGGGPPF